MGADILSVKQGGAVARWNRFIPRLHTDQGIIGMGWRFGEFAPFANEDLVDALNMDAMCKVAESVNIANAGGERLHTRYGFPQYIEREMLDVPQPDSGLTGGITEMRKIAGYAATYGLHVQPHNRAGCGVTAAAVQMDCCQIEFVCIWFLHCARETYVLVNAPLELQSATEFLAIPTVPGVGVELDGGVVS